MGRGSTGGLMTLRIVGQRFGSVTQPADKYSGSADGSFAVETTYRTLWHGWLEKAPSIGNAHPTYPEAKLYSRDAEQHESGYLCDVTLKYKAPTKEAGTPEPGAVLPIDEYTESSNAVEVPIEAHPSFATFATEENGAIFDPPIPPLAQGKFSGWTADSHFAGYMSYVVGSVTESITKYYWGRPASVSDSVGDRSGKWLTVSGSISRRGIYWSRTLNREYRAVGWNSTIYP